MNRRGKGIALSYTYSVLSTVIGVFMSAFILRKLGRSEYGVYQTMTSFLSYIVLFEFGTGTIMTRNISLCAKDGTDADEINKNVSTILSITLILTVVISLAIICFYILIPTVYKKSLTQEQIDYGKTLFIIIGVRTVVSFINQTMYGAILGFEKYSFQQIVKLIYLLLRTGLVIALLFIRPLSITIVIIDTSLTFIELVVVLFYVFGHIGVKFKKSLFDYNIFRAMLPLSLAMFIQTVVNMANGNVDKFVIGVVMSPEAVSVYSIALYIYTIFSSLTTIPISMYMPQIAQNMKHGICGYELTKTLIQPCRLIAIIGGLIIFGFICIGRQFIAVVYGGEYTEAWIIALVIMGPMYLNMCNGVLVNVLDVMRKRMARSLFLLFTTFANIGLTIWWIKTWEMIGAAVATAICTMIGQVILMNIYYYKEIKIKVIYLFKNTLKGTALSLVISCAFGVLITLMFKNNLYLQLFCGGFAFVVIMFICMYIFGANEIEKKRIMDLLKRIT